MSDKVDIEGLDELNKKLEDMELRASNLYPALNAAGYIIARSVRKNIRQQGRPPWNRPSRRVQATGGKTLIKTSRLLKSIWHKVMGNIAYIGTNLIYAPIHHYGGVIRAKSAPYLCFPIPWETTKSGKKKFVKVKQITIPARPFMKIQKEDTRKVLKVFDDYIVRGQR